MMEDSVLEDVTESNINEPGSDIKVLSISSWNLPSSVALTTHTTSDAWPNGKYKINKHKSKVVY